MNYLIKTREREKKHSFRFIYYFSSESRYTNILIYLGYIVEPIFIANFSRYRPLALYKINIREKELYIWIRGFISLFYCCCFLSHICTLDERREKGD